MASSGSREPGLGRARSPAATADPPRGPLPRPRASGRPPANAIWDDLVMRLATIRTDQGTRAARVEGTRVVELDHADVGALLAAGPEALATARTVTGPGHDLASVDLAPV